MPSPAGAQKGGLAQAPRLTGSQPLNGSLGHGSCLRSEARLRRFATRRQETLALTFSRQNLDFGLFSDRNPTRPLGQDLPSKSHPDTFRGLGRNVPWGTRFVPVVG